MTDQTTPEPLTDDELEEIRARLAASSPSPWEATPNGRILGQPRPEHAYERDVAEALFTADAELIAHAPDDLAHLLDEVARLRAQLTEAGARFLTQTIHDRKDHR